MLREGTALFVSPVMKEMILRPGTSTQHRGAETMLWTNNVTWVETMLWGSDADNYVMLWGSDAT